MKGNQLVTGAFELAVLSVLKADDDVTAQSIAPLLETGLGRLVTAGALYTTLDRLIRKGYVQRGTLPARPIRGGRTRRTFRRTMMGDDIAIRTAAALAGLGVGGPKVALFEEIKAELAGITPEKYRRPNQEPLKGVEKLGPATDRIKQLQTFWSLLKSDMRDLDMFLRLNGLDGNEDKFRLLNRKHLQERAVHGALGDEVGREFDRYGSPFGIDLNWDVYVPK